MEVVITSQTQVVLLGRFLYRAVKGISQYLRLWLGIEPSEGKGDEPRLDHLTA